MGKIFTRKQFSSYLGEQRAILDVDTSYFLDPSPTPSPTPIVVTATPTPTPSSTPASTPLPPTPTPSPTPSGVAPGSVFNIGSGFDGDVDSILIDPLTDDLFVSGAFNFYDGTQTFKLVKMNNSGTIDPTFVNRFTQLTNTRIYDMALDGSNLWLVGNFVQTYDAVTVQRLLKIDTTTGAISSGWTPKTANNTIFTADMDGSKLVITGQFTTFDTVARNRIARINSDGTLDTTITFGAGFNNISNKLIINNAGNYVVVGSWTLYNGLTANRIVEIDSTTGLDTGLFGSGFNGTVSDVVYDDANDLYYCLTNDTVSYQGGGARQIHVIDNTGAEINAGNIQTGTVPQVLFLDKTNGDMYLGRSQFNVINYYKFDPVTLTKDATWEANIGVSNSGPSANGQIQIASDGSRIYLTGRFTFFNGQNYNRIYRVNSDGTSNTTI